MINYMLATICYELEITKGVIIYFATDWAFVKYPFVTCAHFTLNAHFYFKRKNWHFWCSVTFFKLVFPQLMLAIFLPFLSFLWFCYNISFVTWFIVAIFLNAIQSDHGVFLLNFLHVQLINITFYEMEYKKKNIRKEKNMFQFTWAFISFIFLPKFIWYFASR